MKYLKNMLSLKRTPQSQPIPGTNQVPNSAGGYAFPLDDWARLDRFLILGSEGGSYYACERKLATENAEAVVRCIEVDGPRVVARVAEISDSGRAPKNDPAIFALAICSAKGDAVTRRAALAALPKVCRIGTHLFHFAEFVDGFRGWGRGLRGAVASWYNDLPADRLAYQAVKYQARDAWSHRDLLRLSHPIPVDETRKALYGWITKGWEDVGEVRTADDPLRLLWAFEAAKRADAPGEIASLIREAKLPREAVPTHWLKHRKVWEALLEEMPMTALIRNLAAMTRAGVLDDFETAERIAARITDSNALRKARIHPIAVLSALKTYSQGRGERGTGEWTPVQNIVDALDAAFYASFGNVEATGKRWMLALDVSSSMTWGRIAGVPGLTPRTATAAMAMVTAAVEPNHTFTAFCHEMVPDSISPRQRLDDIVRRMDAMTFGGTDCALPMLYATKNRLPIDVFVVLTDSETWFGQVHPVQALREYRQRTGIGAKLIVVGMVSNGFTIADPNDGGMMDVVGFDTATPQIMADFAKA